MCIYIFTYINTIDKNPNEMKTAKRITRKKRRRRRRGRKKKEAEEEKILGWKNNLQTFRVRG